MYSECVSRTEREESVENAITRQSARESTDTQSEARLNLWFLLRIMNESFFFNTFTRYLSHRWLCLLAFYFSSLRSSRLIRLQSHRFIDSGWELEFDFLLIWRLTDEYDIHHEKSRIDCYHWRSDCARRREVKVNRIMLSSHVTRWVMDQTYSSSVQLLWQMSQSRPRVSSWNLSTSSIHFSHTWLSRHIIIYSATTSIISKLRCMNNFFFFCNQMASASSTSQSIMPVRPFFNLINGGWSRKRALKQFIRRAQSAFFYFSLIILRVCKWKLL